MQKYQHIFNTIHLQDDLKKRSLRSGAVTLTSQGLQFVIQLGSTMILARILSPADYGINAMAVAITGLAGVFSSLGLSTATIQRADINHEQVSTLFWINAGIGLLLTLIIAAISPVVAWFYGTSEMFLVMASLSLTFTISGLSVQHSALLTRQMRFVALAVAQILALLTGILVAIIAGYHAFGYWALVFNTLTNVTVYTLGVWLFCRWVPGLPKRDAGVREMVKFGGDLVGFNVVNYFARNFDNILIGRYHGSGALGFYSKAYQLMMMPITNLRDPMNAVAMPALSRLQNNPVQYQEYYKKYVSSLSFLSMPLVTFVFVFSDSIILIVLGDQWIESIIILKILAVVSFVQPSISSRGLVLLTLGYTRKYLYLGILSATTICASFSIGVMWGPTGVAYAYAVSTYVFLIPYMAIALHKTPVSLSDFFKSIIRPAIVSVSYGLVFISFKNYIVNTNSFFILIIYFIMSWILYLIIFMLVPGGKKEVFEYLSYFKYCFFKKQ